MKKIVTIRHGSHLYGTNTASSDEDFKSVHIPSAENIIFQKADKVEDYSTNKTSVKNTKEDIDHQSIPVHKFLDMIVAGDTVATEILFAPDEMIVSKTTEWALVQEVGKKLLNRQCKGFVGYCQRQAAKYGIKGSRMAACKAASDMFYDAIVDFGRTAKLEAISATLEEFVEEHTHSSLIEIEGANGKVMHFECVDRKVPFSATLGTAYDLYTKIYDNYGERARQAMDNENIDWKAVSHAVRVANQATELLNTGNITFPRPEAAFLLEIKQGKLEYNDISKKLEGLVQGVETVSETSTLPLESDLSHRERLVYNLYANVVIDNMEFPY